MYLRFKTSKKSKHSTAQIVKSYRNPQGKVKQVVIASLGVIRTEEDKNNLIKLAHNLIAKFSQEESGQLNLPGIDYSYQKAEKKKPVSPDKFNYKNLNHVKDYQIGFDEVYGKLSEDVGFDSILSEIDNTRKNTFSALEIIKSLIINRIKEPESKRATFLRDHLDKSDSSFDLHHIYRAMDLLVPFVDKIQTKAHGAATHLFSEVKSYFYDATTLFFESVTSDELKNFGYSKDAKFNQVQIVICLLVTNEGIPIGYEVFSGNTAETKTLKTAIKNLSHRYNVKNHTVVCDRGMLSNENLTAVGSPNSDMFYIVGEKLRKLPQGFQQVIFTSDGYENIGETRVKIVTHPTRPNTRLLLAYSPDRAKKDKADREKLIKKLQKRFQKKQKQSPKSFVNNYGIKKYVNFSGGQAQLNLEAIAHDERWDGYFGIVTNNPDLTSEDILGQYRGLWQVEANFRVFKHNLAARPIYHWTEKRIRAHVLICFMSLVLERHLYARLKKAQTPMSSTQIHNSLRMCKNIILQDSETFRVFQISTNKPIEAKQIYDLVGLNWRSQTVELPNPKKNVVPSLSVK